MIRIYANETRVCLKADIPRHLTMGNPRYYELTLELGGSAPAVAAVVKAMDDAMSVRIAKIREEAYLQGARDRAQKCSVFSGSWDVGLHQGGCH